MTRIIRIIKSMSVAGRLLTIFILLGASSGCAGTRRCHWRPVDDPAPADGVQSLSACADADEQLTPAELENLLQDHAQGVQPGGVQPGETLSADSPAPLQVLLLSGGGSHGAFGADLLSGWSKADDPHRRPPFTIVTGVSTGALLATAAFLGPDHDCTLKKAYTTISTSDVYKPRFLPIVPFSDSLMDTTPLSNLILEHVKDKVINEVADAYESPDSRRFLFVATVNLDTGKFTIWKMGAIAAKRTDEARRRYRQVILASASIPVLFPPVEISTMREKDGGMQVRNFLHTDGGARATVFFRQFMIVMTKTLQAPGDLYVIMNGRLGMDIPDSELCINRKIIPIAMRSIQALMDESCSNALFRVHVLCGENLRFNLASIGADFPELWPAHEFPTTEMGQLFDYGYELGRKGYPWQREPPDAAEEIERMRAKILR